jgi:uracil-DNA glycosylase family 4
MEHPDSEQIALGNAAAGRAVLSFQCLLEKIGIAQDDVYYSTMTGCAPTTPQVEQEAWKVCRQRVWRGLQTVKPKVILTMGRLASIRLLLNFKKSTKLKELLGNVYRVGYTTAIVMPWYSVTSLMHQGKKQEEKTLDWLKKVKESING